MSFTYTIDSQKIGGDRIIEPYLVKLPFTGWKTTLTILKIIFWTKTKTTTPMEAGTTYPKNIG